jgi:hypothetical protein
MPGTEPLRTPLVVGPPNSPETPDARARPGMAWLRPSAPIGAAIFSWKKFDGCG